MPFDPKQLRSFLAVVDCGSIGMAADAINITQPALSRIIRNLELRHGVQLFERTSTGAVLTQAGEALVPRARMLLFELEGAADELRAFRGLNKGSVRVGAVSAVVRTILAPAVARLFESAPHLQVKVIEGHDNALFNALVAHEIDLVLSPNTNVSEDVCALAECRLQDVNSVFCSAQNDIEVDGKDLASILPGAWALPPKGTTPHTLLDGLIRKQRLPRPNVVVETVSPATMIACVTHSNLLGWLPDPVCENGYLAGTIRKLDVPQLKLIRQFHLFSRSKGSLSPAAKAFAAVLPLKSAL